jgi:NADH-quinone oxidoreductase subunit L
MFANMQNVYLAIPLVCLGGALLAGLFGKWIGRIGAHTVTILGVATSFALSVLVFNDTVLHGHVFNGPVYAWGQSGGIPMEIGFLIDPLSAMMMVVVTFVSLMVHIYTIGYMHDDPGYQRFFSYIALFTFAMLMLVMSNNFLQLFFGWEAVGLVSYLLIGFWYTRETAIFANLKAFLVNRVGDFGFLLGIAAIYYHFGTLDYGAVFGMAPAPQLAAKTVQIIPGVDWSLMTVICLLLFVGAMGKSAQVPLHVWLPDSMEGPTPISALIHAATMVTAGIFMVARMSPLYELSETALSVILVIGALTAFFMGLIGIVQNDIKRVVAYSTLSQLGYMTVALGASAYSAAIFHLMTHAFFKALLFLGAGSVIMAMHHEQDMTKMGGLKKYMPFTFITAWVGTLALVGFPGAAGFFSKDMIIEAVHHAHRPGATFAYVLVLCGVFVTSFYSFRLLFLTYYGQPRMDEHTRQHLHESPAVVVIPLLLLAVPSLVAGWLYIDPMLFGKFFAGAIHVDPAHDALKMIGVEFHKNEGFAELRMMFHGFQTIPFLLLLGGFGLAWLFYIRDPRLADMARSRLQVVYNVLQRKYGFDDFYQTVFAGGARRLGSLFWRYGDVKAIDGTAVNGTARLIGWIASIARHVQSGYIYHYAFAMILGLFLLITFFLHR